MTNYYDDEPTAFDPHPVKNAVKMYRLHTNDNIPEVITDWLIKLYDEIQELKDKNGTRN